MLNAYQGERDRYPELRSPALEIAEQSFVFLLHVIGVNGLTSHVCVGIVFKVSGICRMVNPGDDGPFHAPVEQVIPIDVLKERVCFDSCRAA